MIASVVKYWDKVGLANNWRTFLHNVNVLGLWLVVDAFKLGTN